MKSILTLFLLSITCTFISAQVTLTQFPKDNQLYPRDVATNKAQVHISGTLGNVVADSIFFNLTTSDGLSSDLAFSLSDFPNDSFDLAFDMEAMLRSYQFTLSFKSADSTWIAATAINVVAGDVFVIEGQSNAQAIFNTGDGNIWQSNYVRCFGSPDPAGYTNQQWYIAEANGYFTPGAIGQWALRMGSVLQESLQIPIAIINGADPGKPIEFFQRNDALPTDSSTNYGRLLQRLNNAGLTHHVRGVLYYQGESDGDRAEIHKSLFEALYADWVEDFQNVEAFYNVQVREGCGAPSLQLREYQKDFENYLPRFKCMTANGIAGHDGCHYSVNGYQQLGEKMAKAVSADLYNKPSGQQLNVRVLDAQYTDNYNTQITLTTDASSLVAQPGSGLDFKILGTPVAVLGIYIDGSKIILDLDGPVYDANARISYAGHSGDANGWVLNGDGYGLFSFYDMPVSNHVFLPHFDNPGIMSGPGNCLVFDGIDDQIYIGGVLNKSYTKEAWINWQGTGGANNIISGAANTAFWLPSIGADCFLASGHNGQWGQVIDPMPMVANKWTHVAVTYDDSLQELRLYKNGNLVSQAENVPAHNDSILYIGSYAGCCTFPGKIDEVRVWNSARSIEQIRANMCQKLTGQEAGLSSYFRFDQLSGTVVPNETNNPDGQMIGFQTPGWQRSAVPLGTKSTYVYTDTNHLSLALPSGDSLVLSDLSVPQFVHLYFTEEIPNVLQPADGYTILDNQRYFGLFYPDQSIDSFTLTYHYTGNPFATISEHQLGLLQRKNNAQPIWNIPDSVLLDFNTNFIRTSGHTYQEYILALKDNTVGIRDPYLKSGMVYPNPAQGLLHFRDIQPQEVCIFNAFGNKCMEVKGAVSVLDIGKLCTGLYFVEVRDLKGNMYKQKVLILGE